MTAPATGTLGRLDAMAVGVAAWRLGAGRARKEDEVSRHRRRRVARHRRRPASRRASRCSSSTSTTRPACRPPWRPSTGAVEITPDPVAPPPLVLGHVS